MKNIASLWGVVAVGCIGVYAHGQTIGAEQDFIRTRVPDIRETTNYVTNGERWPGGVFHWYYNPENQPKNLLTADVLSAIEVAMSRWSQMCQLTFDFKGFTSASRNFQTDAVDGLNVIGWQSFPTLQNASDGLTFWNLRGASIVDADIVFNTFYTWTLLDFEAVVTHELGHAIGLRHSNVARSVMYASPYNSNTYLRTLRGDDAPACTVLYGASPSQLVNRTLNYAETAYASALQEGPAATQVTSDGYVFRYYGKSNSRAGAKDGVAYYMGPDGVLQNMGPLDSFTPFVTAGGF